MSTHKKSILSSWTIRIRAPKKFVVTQKLTIRMIYKSVMMIYGSKAGTFKLTMIEIKLETLKTEWGMLFPKIPLNPITNWQQSGYSDRSQESKARLLKLMIKNVTGDSVNCTIKVTLNTSMSIWKRIPCIPKLFYGNNKF